MENDQTNQTAECPHCGAAMKEWHHTLSVGLVICLIKAIKFVKNRNINKFHLRDLELTQNEYNNFQKLRFHGLIAHADKDNIKSGYWLITTRGGQFLRGEVSVPKRVKTYRNQVIGHDTELVHISKFRGETGWFESDFKFDIHEGRLVQKMQTSISSGQPLPLFK